MGAEHVEEKKNNLVGLRPGLEKKSLIYLMSHIHVQYVPVCSKV